MKYIFIFTAFGCTLLVVGGNLWALDNTSASISCVVVGMFNIVVSMAMYYMLGQMDTFQGHDEN